MTGFVAVAMLGAAWFAWSKPHAFAGVSLLAIVLAKPLEHWVGEWVSPLDEVLPLLCLAAFSIRRVTSGHRLRSFPGLAWFLLFGLFGFVSSFFNQVSSGTAALGMFLALKGLVFGLAVAQLTWEDRQLRKTITMCGLFLAVVVIGAVVNMAAPSSWNSVFSLSGLVDYQLGLPSIVSLFVHPGDLGLVAALGCVAALSYFQVVRRSWLSAALIISLGIAACASLRRKTWVGLGVSVSWVLIHTRAAVFILPLVVCLFGVGILIWLPLESLAASTYDQYVAGWSSSPRTLLWIGSFDLATDYFPFGAGFSRYGSYLASADYSPEYVRMGFPAVWGLQPDVAGGFGGYLTDTMWPAILGESGLLGLLAYIAGFVGCALFLRGSCRSPDRLTRFLGVCGIGWLCQLVVESVAAPVFVSSPGFPMLFAVVGVAVARRGASPPWGSNPGVGSAASADRQGS